MYCPCKQGRESPCYDSHSCRIIRKLFLGPWSFTEKLNELQHSLCYPEENHTHVIWVCVVYSFASKGLWPWADLRCEVPGAERLLELSWGTRGGTGSPAGNIPQQSPQVCSQTPYPRYRENLISQQNDEFPSQLYYCSIPQGAFNSLIDCPFLLLKCCVAYCWLLSLESVLKD